MANTVALRNSKIDAIRSDRDYARETEELLSDEVAYLTTFFREAHAAGSVEDMRQAAQERLQARFAARAAGDEVERLARLMARYTG